MIIAVNWQSIIWSANLLQLPYLKFIIVKIHIEKKKDLNYDKILEKEKNNCQTYINRYIVYNRYKGKENEEKLSIIELNSGT